MRHSLGQLLRGRRARLARAFRQEDRGGIRAAERNWEAASRWSGAVERHLLEDGSSCRLIDAVLCPEHLEVVEPLAEVAS